MPRSRTRSPDTKSSSRHHSKSQTSSKYRQRSRHSRSPSKSLKSRHRSPPVSSSNKERSSTRRSRSPSGGHKHSRSKAKHYSSRSGSNSRRRSRSRESSYHHRSRSNRTESSKDHYRSSRRRDDSTSSSSSSSDTSSNSSSSTSSSRSSRRSRSPTQAKPRRPKPVAAAAAFIPLSTHKGSPRPPIKYPPTSSASQSPLHRPFGIRPGITKSMFLLTLGDKATTADGPSTFASVQQLNDEPMLPETLAQINANGFQAKSFVSSANKVASEKVVINLDAETVSVPMHAAVEAVDPVFNPTLFGDDSARMEKWVKKLFVYRQKAFQSNI